MFAVLTVVLVVIAGSSIDYSRAIANRGKMANALDAAALTVASQLSSSIMTDEEIGAALEDAFSANLESMGLNTAAIANLDFTVDSENGIIDVSSNVTVDTYFIQLGGIGPESLTVGVSTQVNYSKFDVELALIVDVTGSMWADVDTLQDASESLLDTLIPDGTSEDDSKVKISIIPYSEGVNLGPYANKVANGAQGTRNCVTERLGTAQYTDDPYDYDSGNDDSYFGGGSSGCASSPQLVPLTAKRNKLETAIRQLSASGGTSGQTGIAWGWYTLSPNWSNLWPSDSAPGAYDDDDLLKFAVIMTDGDFNRYYYKQSLSKNYCNYYKRYGYVTETCRNGYNDYWFPAGSSGYSGTSSVRAREFCDAMKDEGIQIYTVYFGNSSSSAGARVMQDCASSDTTYYEATSSSSLINAFGNIAKKIQSIYLAK